MSNTGFQLKASSLTFTSMILFTPNLDLVEAQLANLIAKTPQFFNYTPIVLDLTDIETRNLPIDLIKLLHLVREHRLCPIGIKSYNNANKDLAKSLHLAIIAQTETPATAEKIASEAKAATKVVPSTNTKIIDQAVRSGKQIYAKASDLIVTTAVSHGAEVIADGNIHVYGTLNGRALAGAQGNQDARIYCTNLESELIAIAGHYLVNEQIPDEYKNRHQLLEIFLEGSKLQFKLL